MKIACLCVTHARPEWMPWVLHQYTKQDIQSNDRELIVVASGLEFNHRPPPEAKRDDIHLFSTDDSGIAVKRQIALDLAFERGAEAIAWFDDDDWSSPMRLFLAQHWLGMSGVAAVGNRTSYLVNAHSPNRAARWVNGEPVIFNGAVYRIANVPRKFARLTTGEDTEWQRRLFDVDPVPYYVASHVMSAWMCHGKNITNRVDKIIFDRPTPIVFDAWEEVFLRNLSK